MLLNFNSDNFVLKLSIKKKLFFFNKFVSFYSLNDFISMNFFKLYFFIKNKLLSIKIPFFFPINNYFFLDNKLYLYNSRYLHINEYKCLFNNFNKIIKSEILNKEFFWFKKIHLLGLGFRVFLYNDSLIFRLGFSHFIKIKIPMNIHVFFRYKSFLILFSNDKSLLSSFVSQLLSIKSFNFYKGKGITFFPSKSDLKLKVRRQQQ